MTPLPLILASSSPYRRALLERLGLPFTSEAPGVDEDAAVEGDAPPEERARRLALRKAKAVAARRPDAVVIGSDQVCAVGDAVLHKPGDAERAVQQLVRLQGRQHRLLTAVAVVHPGGVEELLDVTRLSMRALTEDEVRRSVARDRPFDCAGSYKLEQGGIALFDRIDSADQTAVIGLPLIALCTLLRRLGFPTP